MDLEQFPTSESGQKMLKSVSSVYDNSYFVKWLFQVMGLELDEARSYFNELRNQGFPELATWGIKYWELMYGIPSDTTMTLEARRNRVIYQRTAKAPMNPAKMADLLQKATGAGCSIEEDNANYTFSVLIESLPGGVSETTLSLILDKLKPAHIAYTFNYQQHAPATLYYGGVFTFGRTFTMRQVN